MIEATTKLMQNETLNDQKIKLESAKFDIITTKSSSYLEKESIFNRSYFI